MKNRVLFLKYFFVAIIMFAMVSNNALASKNNTVVQVEGTVNTLDYWQTTARTSIIVGYMMFDPLLERDPETGELKPHLVTSWKVLSPKVWEFKLRDDVFFHNGNKLTAKSVHYTIMKRILDKTVNSPQRSGYKWIEDVKVIDDYTFHIITDTPYPLVVQRMNTLFIYDEKWTEEVVAKHGPTYLNNHVNGTGPFKVVKKTKDTIELVRNENYFKAGVPSYPKMTIRVMNEESTVVAEVLKGNIDSGYVGFDAADRLSGNSRINIIRTKILRVGFIQFDAIGRAADTPKALTDVRVRKAIWHAIDKDLIIESVFPSFTNLNIPINPVSFGAVSGMSHPEYNEAKAKALMKESGYEKGFTLKVYTAVPQIRDYMEAAQPYLQKINIDVDIQFYTGWGEFSKKYSSGNAEGAGGVTWGSYNIFDADALWSYFFMIPESNFNYTNDEMLSGWLHEARKTLDVDKRKVLYQKAQQRIVDQAYWLPTWVQARQLITNKNFHFDYGKDEVPRWQYGKWTN